MRLTIQEGANLYLHVVMLAFHKPVTTALREQMESCFQAVRRECEGWLRFELVDNQSRTSASYTHALLSVFSHQEALDAYRISPAHDRLMSELGPHIKEIVVLDTCLGQGDKL